MSAGPDKVKSDVPVTSVDVSADYAEVLVSSRPPGAPVVGKDGATHAPTVTQSSGLSSRHCASSRRPRSRRPLTSLHNPRHPGEVSLTSRCHNRPLTLKRCGSHVDSPPLDPTSAHLSFIILKQNALLEKIRDASKLGGNYAEVAAEQKMMENLKKDDEAALTLRSCYGQIPFKFH